MECFDARRRANHCAQRHGIPLYGRVRQVLWGGYLYLPAVRGPVVQIGRQVQLWLWLASFRRRNPWCGAAGIRCRRAACGDTLRQLRRPLGPRFHGRTADREKYPPLREFIVYEVCAKGKSIVTMPTDEKRSPTFRLRFFC